MSVCLWCESLGIVMANWDTQFVRCIYYGIVCCWLYQWIPLCGNFKFGFLSHLPCFVRTLVTHQMTNKMSEQKISKLIGIIHNNSPRGEHTTNPNTVNLVSLSLSMWTLGWCSHNAFACFPSTTIVPLDFEFRFEKLLLLFDIQIFPSNHPPVWHTNQHWLFVQFNKIGVL